MQRAVIWSEERAEDEIIDRKRRVAAARFREDAGPCPNCGADAEVDVINVTGLGSREPQFIAGEVFCSARCDVISPQKYLAAVRARKCS